MNDLFSEQDTSGVETRPESKSARKRALTELQNRVQQLAALKPAQICEIALPADLESALIDSHRLSSSSARNRQIRHCANLIKGQPEVIAQVEQYFQNREKQGRQSLNIERQINAWVERLLNDSSSLADLINEYPDIDRQQLRTLVRNASKKLSSATSDEPSPATRKIKDLLRPFFHNR